MIECAIIGDSIAQGVAQFNRTCMSETIVGITSQQHAGRFLSPINASRTLISLGSNDGIGQDTEAAMLRVRSRISNGQVTWLLSSNNDRANAIARRIARLNGDKVIEVRPFVGSDKVHPTPGGYSRLSAIWRTD